MATRDERIRQNQDLFRAGNSAIASTVARHGAHEQALDFLCECFDTACLGRVKLSLDEYRQLTKGDRYVVMSGHEGPDEICERRDGYSLVAK